MPRIDVPFTVTEQVLRQYPPTLLRAGDKNYFYATFNVCEKWADVAELRAVFERSDLERPYVQDLVQGNGCYECIIPWEVMQTPGIVRVGVFGGDRILTNKVDVSVSVGCSCDGDTPQSPTRDWFLRIEGLIQELGTPDPEAIAAAVADYIAANPIEEKDPTVPAWAKAEKKPEYSAEEVGAISETELQTAINGALAQAKESGEFDGSDGKDGTNGKDGVSCTHSWGGTVLTVTSASGTSSADLKGDKGDKGETGEPGAPGAAGADGYTPVKGTDYFTDADKEEIATAAAEKVSIPEALPNPYPLTFTGAVEGSYDGSAAVTVEIPSGGGGDGGSSAFKIVTETTEEVSAVEWNLPANWEKIIQLNVHATVPSLDSDLEVYMYTGTYKSICKLTAGYLNGIDIYILRLYEKYLGIGIATAKTYPANARPVMPTGAIDPDATLNTLRIYSSTSGVNLPIGTKFVIWGVYAP